MAGGTATKTTVLCNVALARMQDAAKAIQQVNQNGLPSADTRHAVSDPAITAAITALQALV